MMPPQRFLGHFLHLFRQDAILLCRLILKNMVFVGQHLSGGSEFLDAVRIVLLLEKGWVAPSLRQSSLIGED